MKWFLILMLPIMGLAQSSPSLLKTSGLRDCGSGIRQSAQCGALIGTTAAAFILGVDLLVLPWFTEKGWYGSFKYRGQKSVGPVNWKRNYLVSSSVIMITSSMVGAAVGVGFYQWQRLLKTKVGACPLHSCLGARREDSQTSVSIDID